MASFLSGYKGLVLKEKQFISNSVSKVSSRNALLRDDTKKGCDREVKKYKNAISQFIAAVRS